MSNPENCRRIFIFLWISLVLRWAVCDDGSGFYEFKKPAWGWRLKWVIKNLRSPASGQFIVSRFDEQSHGTINQIFMECEVCGKPSKQKAKVFIKGAELYLCPKCVLRLQRERLKFYEERQGYRFNGIRRQRGRIWGIHRLPKEKQRAWFKADFLFGEWKKTLGCVVPRSVPRPGENPAVKKSQHKTPLIFSYAAPPFSGLARPI